MTTSGTDKACSMVHSHKYYSYKEHEDKVEEELVDKGYGNLDNGCIQ